MKTQTVQFIIAFSLLLAVCATQAECTPSLIGSPCAYGGIASAGQIEPSITLAAGNPVHLATGNKYQHEVDLPPNPDAPGLELVRHYNAMDPRTSVLGHGWALSYDTRLYHAKNGWQIIQADGGRVDFPAENAVPNSVNTSRHGRLTHHTDHHDWAWPSGTTLRFDRKGYLTGIDWPGGQRITIDRHDGAGPREGAIRQVADDQGQTLTFHYRITGQQAHLSAVDTPLGRFSYHYDTPIGDNHSKGINTKETSREGAQSHDRRPLYRLINVERPDTMQRHYLYEPELQSGHAHALTGIEISSGKTAERERTNTWAYDVQGRAVRSISGGPHSTHRRLQFDYRTTPTAQKPGLTVVSDADQQKTYFHTAIQGGRHVLTSVQGAGCFGCAAPGTRADYDNRGRLIQINGTRIQRTSSGTIQSLHPARSGWPQLALHYNANGLRERWHSQATGTERIRYNAQGLPIERRFANGDTTTIGYDAQHRPVRMEDTHGDAQSTTRLHWYGHQLVRIEHPAETEVRHYDESGRVRQRNILRNTPGSAFELSEQFLYDDLNRVTRHDLPEGGSLHYHWGWGAQLKAIYWQDINGRRHTIIKTLPGQPGYRYGNGLHLDTAAGPDHGVRVLRLRHHDQQIWAQELGVDSRQRIKTETLYTGTAADPADVRRWHYAYDEHSRLAGYRLDHGSDMGIKTPVDANAGEAADATVWQAWNADGSAAAIRTQAETRRPVIRRDASGLARHAHGYDLSYGPGRRLAHVRRHGQQIVSYQHNAFGYRIWRENAQGQRHDFFYLNNQLVAEAKHAPSAEVDHTRAHRITRRYVYAHHVPVAVIDYSAAVPAGHNYAVHADLQGAPRLVTDHDGRIRWQADYSPLGKALNVSGDLRLDLRLPGQTEDPDTGWHDNLLRTYHPEWGHYVEPDPLGPVPGNQAYGYAGQQPRRYADPMGLLLFAFDGTRQSADTQSNVWKLSQYYLDGPVHYHTGPGNSAFVDWDAVTAHQVSQIIETQWKWLIFELSRPQAAATVTPIDILGFSRGAALARHFGNMISQHVSQGLFQFNDPLFGSVSACVDLRFMGLFDTVAQFGIAGIQNRNYDLNIAAAWEWVAHAVALHERRGLFPLTAAGSTHGHNVVEAPFIGAHSDIGGGILPVNRGEPGGTGDLSDVALNWMIWQARAASVPFGSISSEDGTIETPIVHDFRSAALRTVQDGDRSVDSASGQTWLSYQDDHPRLGRSLREQTERLITRPENWRRDAGVEVGLVDMEGYAQWLYDELGWHALPV